MATPLGSRYVLHEQIGKGAMGRVHRGETVDGGAAVAIKVLRPELADDEALLARFLRERSLLTGVDHPGLVRYHDVVVEGGTVALAMDLVPGGDLRTELRERGTLPVAEALTLAAGVLDGLAALHAGGIVHRDVKPENVLLDRDGEAARPRVTDFGISKLAESTLSRTTGIVGTPEYLSPEVCNGEEAIAASDVYAAGILTYELLGGRTPFAGGVPIAVVRRHLEDTPAPIPGLPAEVADWLCQLLAKEPSERPAATDAAERARHLAFAHRDVPALTPLAPLAADPGRRVSGEGPDGMDERSTVIRPGPAAAAATTSTATVKRPPRSARRLAVGAGLAVLVTVGLIAALLVLTPGSASAASISFPPTQYERPELDGLVVSRTWTLQDGVLTSDVLLTNNPGPTRLADAPAIYREVLPNSVATEAAAVDTSGPLAVSATSDDGLVVLSVELADVPLGGDGAFRYEVEVGGSGPERLRALVADQQRAQAGYEGPDAPVVLAELEVVPVTLTLAPGETRQPSVSGILDSGDVAPAGLLGAVRWRSDDPAVATVDDQGVITATGPGQTRVVVRAGRLSASLTVIVPPAATTPSTTGTTKDTSTTTKKPGGGSTTVPTTIGSSTTALVVQPPPPPPPTPKAWNGLECQIIGTEGNDVLRGTDAGEVICGLGGDDVILPGLGTDYVDGGAGNDTISYDGYSSGGMGIGISLEYQDAYPLAKGGEQDFLNGFEHAVGTQLDDLIAGFLSRSEAIRGLGGNDHINAYAGANDVDGGVGHDTCYGDGRRVNCEN